MIKVQISGLSQLAQQLAALATNANQVIEEVITDVVTDTHANAIQGILRSGGTGRVYQKYNPRRTHQASSPGAYPASDTGRLASSIGFVLPSGGSLNGMVGTNLVYGRYLEFGTSRMAARPWLLPSFKKASADVERELKARLEASI